MYPIGQRDNSHQAIYISKHSPFIVCNCNHRIAKNNRIGQLFFMQTLPAQNKKPVYFLVYCICCQEKNYKPSGSLD